MEAGVDVDGDDVHALLAKDLTPAAGAAKELQCYWLVHSFFNLWTRKKETKEGERNVPRRGKEMDEEGAILVGGGENLCDLYVSEDEGHVESIGDCGGRGMVHDSLYPERSGVSDKDQISTGAIAD